MEFLFHFLWTPLAVFVVGYILLRVSGKKAVSRMNGFDLLVVLVLGTTITEPIVTKRLGIASYYALVITVTYVIFSKISLKQNRFKKWLIPSPTVLIRGGDIDKKGLEKTNLTIEELVAELRVKGYPKTSDVELAVMEETGQISVIPKSTVRPLQPSDVQMTPSPTFIPIPLIIDGEIIDHNLKYIDRDRNWLYTNLQAYNIDPKNVKNIILATYNQNGYVEVDTNELNDHKRGIYNYKPGNEN